MFVASSSALSFPEIMMRNSIIPLVLWGCLLDPGGNRVGEAAESSEDLAFFEKQVRPVLVQHCQECHGPKKQHAGLSLTSREALLKGGESGPAIVSGKSAESLLVLAIRHTGEASAMPPEKKLAEREIASLVEWIDRGAPWPIDPAPMSGSGPVAAEALWSLRPVQVTPAPTAADSEWNQNEIDRFLHAGHIAGQVRPVGLADRTTWLRRVTNDLTGLPPTPDELASFLKDESAEATRRVTERLLASPHYGERWGRHWLDVVRYADTAGDGADYPVREAYLYRNYVIDSFNKDKPYDVFLREQLAGDILARQAADSGTQTPEQYAERVIATGFLAIGKRFGYNDNAEFVHLDLSDTIDTVGRSLLGLSLGCARCHDHKYDPVSAADYYSLYGIFGSTRFAFPGGEELKRPRHFVPLIPPADAAAREKTRAEELARLDGEIQKLDREHATLDAARIGGGTGYGFEQQETGKPPGSPWFTDGPNQILAEAQSPFTNVHPAGTRGARVRNERPHGGVRMEFADHTAATSPQLEFNIDFRNVNAVEGDAAYRLYSGHGAIISLAFEASVSSSEIHVRNGKDWELLSSLATGSWYNLRMTFDLVKKTYSGTLWKHGDAAPLAFQDKKFAPGWDGIINTFISDGIGKAPGTPPTRDFDNLGIQNRPFTPPEQISAPTPEQLARLRTIEAELPKQKARRAELAAQPLYEVAYAVQEGTAANARIQKRGEPDRLGDEVPRRNLQIFGAEPVPGGAGSGRLQLAEWLTQPSNPLVARVFVNRVWQHHFGAGLVKTSSDFGARGELPSHPELLDSLTDAFIRSGWSVKSLHRMILATRAYQLSSADDAQNLLADSQNRLLWRYSRRPMDAESIRDSILAQSGELDRSMPAGHPFPPVDSWSFTIHYPFKAYYESKHRSVYQMVQRSVKHPYLSLFDGADPNVSAAERYLTTTPTQALYLMNSPFVHAQSRSFARRIRSAAADDPARIRFAIETVYGRTPPPDEVARHQQFVAMCRERAAAAGKSGEEQTLEAWAAFARVLWTSNEFLFIE